MTSENSHMASSALQICNLNRSLKIVGVDPYMASTLKSAFKYKMTQQVSDLGWVDMEFGCSTSSTVCPIQLWLIRDRHNDKHLGKMSGTSKSKANQPRSETCCVAL